LFITTYNKTVLVYNCIKGKILNMYRKSVVTINLEAIKNNYLVAKSESAPAKVVAIIKANAYGHGAVKVAQHLDEIADIFGVACLEEALELIDISIATPILLLEGIFNAEDLAIVDEFNIQIVVSTQHQYNLVMSHDFINKPIIWLKFDTGMGRLGFTDKTEYLQVLQDLSKHAKQIILMSHLSCADDLTSSKTSSQISLFDNVTADLNLKKSLANSAAVLEWRASHYDYVRPGIMLYGVNPVTKGADYALQASMVFEAELISIKSFAAGQTIGYGDTYVCSKKTLVGVVGVGYADGYPRHAKTGMRVYINGQYTKLLGRVSMDMIMVDLTDIPVVNIGDKVELFGRHVSVNELAQNADTISYEILSKITNRVHRR